MKRRLALVSGGWALLMVAGCATPARPRSTARGAEASAWSGRMSLRVDSEPVQTFSALFELRGTAEAGDLVLTSPIGNTLAQLQWSKGEATLKNGAQTQRFASVDALIEGATGAPIPVRALFGWMAGLAEPVAGWRPDLSRVDTGRLQATRESPEPRADLRIVFERA